MRNTRALRSIIQTDTDSALARGEGSVFSPFVHLASQLLRREASNMECRLIASLVDAVDAGEVTNADELATRLSEELDSAFIYPLNAAAYVFGCDNAAAYEDEMGEKAPSIEAQAAWALGDAVRARDEYAALLVRVEGSAE